MITRTLTIIRIKVQQNGYHRCGKRPKTIKHVLENMVAVFTQFARTNSENTEIQKKNHIFTKCWWCRVSERGCSTWLLETWKSGQSVVKSWWVYSVSDGVTVVRTYHWASIKSPFSNRGFWKYHQTSWKPVNNNSHYRQNEKVLVNVLCELKQKCSLCRTKIKRCILFQCIKTAKQTITPKTKLWTLRATSSVNKKHIYYPKFWWHKVVSVVLLCLWFSTYSYQSTFRCTTGIFLSFHWKYLW